MSADKLTILISLIALIVSVVSLVLTHVNWKQSNRPLVSAFIIEDKIVDGVATFNLSIANTGTRPATEVRIYFEPSEFEKLVDPTATREAKMDLASRFGRDSKIPLIRNGEIITGALGHSSRVPATKPMLAYGAEATAELRYKDLEGSSYKVRQPIKVYPRDGFTGISWSSTD